MQGGTILLLFLAAIATRAAEQLNIISRNQWGARAAQGKIEDLSEMPVPYVVIHHSATDACTSQAICQSRIRSFQTYHMDTKHWSDIGYNFLIGEDGNAYEGRGWDKRGAHSVSYNNRSLGICFIGTFTNREPSIAAINTLQKLLTYGVSINKIKENYGLLGHKQTSATDCPGNKLYQLIQTWSHWTRDPTR